MTGSPTREQRTTRNRWVALAVLVLPVLLIAIDMTVLSFAVPHLSEALTPTGTQLLWIVDIYGFMIAGLLVTMGTLGDRIGRRKLLLIGAAAFGAASLLAAFATTAPALIAARALLGAAGATLMPSTLALIRNVFLDEGSRRTAIAVWGAMFAAGNAIGPIVGGWLLEHFWWGSVFLVNLPVMALLLALVPVFVPESRGPKGGRYDIVSAGMSLATMLGLVYAIKTLATRGVNMTALAALVVGFAFGLAFVRRQWRVSEPLLDLRLFQNRPFRVAIVTNLLMTMAFVGSLFVVTQYLQSVLGMRPLAAGLALVPGLALSIFMSMVTVRLMRHFTSSTLLTVALGTMAAGYVVTTQVPVVSGSMTVVAAFALIGSGVGMVQTVTNNIVMSSVGTEKSGAAAAVSETAYEVGSGMGAAVLGSVATAVYATGLSTYATDGPGWADARETVGAAVDIASRLEGNGGAGLLDAARTAFTGAAHVTGVVAVALVIVAALHALRGLAKPESRRRPS